MGSLSFVASLLMALPLATSAAETPPPVEIPGYLYLRSLDGCGILLDASVNPKVVETIRAMNSGHYWLGSCRHGLVDGFGYWVDANPQSWMGAMPAVYLLGQQQPTRASVIQSSGVSEISVGASVQYLLTREDGKTIDTVNVPMVWNIDDPYVPFYTSNNGSFLDDFTFLLMEGPAGAQATTQFSIGGRSCLAAGKKVRGCRALYGEFDVYGVSISTSGAGRPESADQFVLCPDPLRAEGCDALWRQIAGPYLDRAIALAKEVRARLLEETAAIAQRGPAAEAALPGAWKAHWAHHPIDRASTETALRCMAISDLHPVSRADADRIRQKYASAPCLDAITAPLARASAERFLAIDAAGKQQEAEIRQSYAAARAERDAETAQAWSDFFGNVSTMMGAYAAAQAPVPVGGSDLVAAASPAPAYESYGQPLSAGVGASGQQHVRAVHRPELDAGSCVSLVQLAEGDPLTSYGSQVFRNGCGEAVEVFWCKVGDECERGAGGSWTVQAGRSWPVSSGQYRWGACRGANSGGLVRESGGQHTGRYACAGP